MDQFTVPKFIEMKPKIVGPLTFTQFIFIGGAAAICLILYFTLPFYFFLLATIVLMLGSFALAFLQIEGRSLPVILQNFFSFLFSSKIYLWRKKTLAPKIIEKIKPEKITKEEGTTPKIIEKSRLTELSTRIETRTR